MFKTTPKPMCLPVIAALLLSLPAFADTMNVSQDAHIDLGNPSDNQGTVPNLVVSNITDKRMGERLSFLSFELIDLPAGAIVDQAYLRLFVGKVAAQGTLDLYLVLEPWDEHTLSTNTAPDFEPVPFTGFPVSAADNGHFILVDVTPEVQAWLDGSSDNHGFVIAANPGTDVDVSFDSKENSQTSHHGELEIILGVAEGGVDSDDIADGSITSDDIADNTVTSDDIADGSIMSTDIMDESIVGADILDGSIGSTDVDKDAVQLRVTGTCAAGSSIRVIDNMGGVTCEPDDDSGGDITSVQSLPGWGLQGGANSGNALLGIAANGVTSLMIADGTIVAADINENSIQRRVASFCPAGQSIRAISVSGAVTCEVDDDSDTTLDPDLFWQLNGNTATNPIPGGTHFIGTADDTELVLGVNGEQALRLAYIANAGGDSVNVLGGHAVNRIINARGATIGGGGSTGTPDDLPNKVEADFGTISGGRDNSVLGASSNIAGGYSNTISGAVSVIGGGRLNELNETYYSTIAGGDSNKSFDSYTVIGGGAHNEICNPDHFTPEELAAFGAGQGDVIVGGQSNRSCANESFIGGGFANKATGLSSMIIGGAWNRARGRYSLAAGHFTEATKDYGVALGYFAQSVHQSAFVWADSSGGEFYSVRDHQFRLRATGGARFDVGDDAGTAGGNQWVDIRAQAANTRGNNPAQFRLIDTSTGAYLSIGGGWVNASDRERKTDIRTIDPNWVLTQIAGMPIQTWRYKVEGEEIRHIGPMAQDFQATFGFGGDPKGIMSVDADGVAMVAIQALYHVTQELERRTEQLEAQQTRIDALEAAFVRLETRLAPFDDRLTLLSE